MKWTLKLVAEVVPGIPTEHEVATIERIEEFSPATVGLTIGEGKAILAGLQQQMVTAQVQHHGVSIHRCQGCGRAFRTKGYYHSTLRSVYGNVGMRIRRLRGCSCAGLQQSSFSTVFTNQDPTTPELKYLTAKLAALLPFGRVADFLGELLPLGIAGAVQILVAITATQGFHPAHPEVIGIGAQDMNGLTKSQFDPEAVAVEQEYFERIEGEVCGKQENGAAMGMAYDHEADDARGRTPDQIQATIA